MHVPIPIRGPLSIPFRMFGIKSSRMNPNICTLCETMFRRIKKKKQVIVPATVLFADVRGYTSFSELLDSPQIINLLSGFYEDCASVIWKRDGLINKLIGDAILAIFNFPIEHEDHPRQAVLAGIELQKKCGEMKLMIDGLKEFPVGIGIGIHTGDISIGEVGEACRDFTAIGKVVNLSSRLQGAAMPGEVLITEDVYRQVAELFPKAETRVCHLKGIEKPVSAYVLHA